MITEDTKKKNFLFFIFILFLIFFFFFKQKTAYEIYQCDWSSDVCSSDLSMNPATSLRAWALVAKRCRDKSSHSKVELKLSAEIGRASCRERV